MTAAVLGLGSVAAHNRTEREKGRGWWGGGAVGRGQLVEGNGPKAHGLNHKSLTPAPIRNKTSAARADEPPTRPEGAVVWV